MMNLTGLNESEATKPKQKTTVSGKDKRKCMNIAESSKDYLFLLIPRDFSTLQTLRFFLRSFSSFSEKNRQTIYRLPDVSFTRGKNWYIYVMSNNRRSKNSNLNCYYRYYFLKRSKEVLLTLLFEKEVH